MLATSRWGHPSATTRAVEAHSVVIGIRCCLAGRIAGREANHQPTSQPQCHSSDTGVSCSVYMVFHDDTRNAAGSQTSTWEEKKTRSSQARSSQTGTPPAAAAQTGMGHGRGKRTRQIQRSGSTRAQRLRSSRARRSWQRTRCCGKVGAADLVVKDPAAVV